MLYSGEMFLLINILKIVWFIMFIEFSKYLGKNLY